MEELEAGDKGYNPVPPEELEDHIIVYMGLTNNGIQTAKAFYDCYRACMIFQIID